MANNTKGTITRFEVTRALRNDLSYSVNIYSVCAQRIRLVSVVVIGLGGVGAITSELLTRR